MASWEEQSGGGVAGRGVSAGPSWSQVWQVPVLLLGLGLFVLGIYLVMPEREVYEHSVRLDEAGKALQAGNLELAGSILEEVEARLEDASEEVIHGRYWAYLGNLTYQQRVSRYPQAADTEGWRSANERIVRYYRRAEEGYGWVLEGRELRRLAETLVLLGRDEEALGLVDRLADEPARQRYLIVRQLIEQHRSATARPRASVLLPLMDRFRLELEDERDEGLRREQLIWVSGLQAELQLQAGDAAGAIDFLLRRIQRLGGEGPDLAPLHVLLGQAYEAQGRWPRARRAYSWARERVSESDGLNAEILLGLGRVALAGEVEPDGGERVVDTAERALGYFAEVTQSFPSEEGYLEVLIRRADCEARLGRHEVAEEQLRSAVSRLGELGLRGDERRGLAREVVHRHVSDLSEREEYRRALDLLGTIRPLYGDEAPPALVLDFARLHERVGEQIRESVMDVEREARPTEEARRLANREAAEHFRQSARHYFAHARAVSVVDDASHRQSLWQSAHNYGRAQRWDEAIEVYTLFLQTRQEDPLRLAARNRLGKAYLADGQYAAARDLFVELVEDHPRSPEAYDSMVPLARAYLGLGELEAAERQLVQVIGDHDAITPRTSEYRQSLIELGRLYYRLGSEDSRYYAKAIERLREAVDRYGQSEASARLRYLLADSYRQSVRGLASEAAGELSPQARRELGRERDRRLELSQMYFNQVITELESRDPDRLTALERLYLRNAYFYQADAAYDRGRYELAIELYHDAALRWRDHPASLVALVQIFNAHYEMGQYQEARAANERARRHLARIPDEAFEDETLPMSRRHWEAWLENANEIEGREPQAAR